MTLKPAGTQHRVPLPVSPSLYFCSLLECDILNTRVLEYVFLMSRTSLGVSHRPNCCCLIQRLSCCADRLGSSFRAEDTGGTRRKWCGPHGSFSNYAVVVCTISAFQEDLPVSRCPRSVFCCRWIGRCRCFVYFSIME